MSELSAVQGAFRFALEIAALIAWGVAGWRWAGSALPGSPQLRWLGAAALVATAAVLWVTFRVPEDASASGSAPVVVSGWVRLGLELAVLLGAAAAVAAVGYYRFGIILAILVLLHYVATWSRVSWLLAN